MGVNKKSEVGFQAVMGNQYREQLSEILKIEAFRMSSPKRPRWLEDFGP